MTLHEVALRHPTGYDYSMVMQRQWRFKVNNKQPTVQTVKRKVNGKQMSLQGYRRQFEVTGS